MTSMLRDYENEHSTTLKTYAGLGPLGQCGQLRRLPK